jgi:large subunit ribosomal protein L18
MFRLAKRQTKMRIRQTLNGTDARPRISVFRSSKHIYAQLISDESHKTIAAASTLDKEVADQIAAVKLEGRTAKSTKSVAAAKAVGLVLAKRCKEQNVETAVFDRNGFSYTGRVQAVADGAREGGLKF